MSKIPLLERFAVQSLVEHEGELIFSKEQFAEQLVKHIVAKIEQEAETAWAHNDGHSYAALSALALKLLDEFDLEMPEEDFDD